MAITRFISTIWSEQLFRELDKKYIAVANCMRDYEGDIKEKGSTVRICGLGPVTISAYTRNTDLSSPETLTDNYRDLIINRAMCFNFQIDDCDRAQSDPKLMSLALHNASSAIANDADAYIYSLYTDAGATITETDLTVSNVINHLIDARTKLLENNVCNAEDIVFEVSPKVAGLILKAKVNLATNNESALEHGCIGSIGGCKIYVSNNIVSTVNENVYNYKCLARTKRAIAFAEQISEVEGYRPEKRFADAVKGLHLYGAKVIYPKEMVTLNFSIDESD